MWKFALLVSILLAYAEGDTSGPDVVNGIKAKEAERPFQVSLQEFGIHFCGASIISKYFIITAAHCTTTFQPEVVQYVFAVVGTLNYHHPGQNHQMETFYAHENYDPSDSFRNDISIGKVAKPFTFNNLVKPVPLPTPHFVVPANSTVVLSGWGELGGGDHTLPDHLRVVSLYHVSLEECKQSDQTGTNSHVYDTNICAYDPNERKGQCTYDSGGPLTYNGILVGVVSWSFKDPTCGSTKRPALYTRVAEYIDWIEEHSNENRKIQLVFN